MVKSKVAARAPAGKSEKSVKTLRLQTIGKVTKWSKPMAVYGLTPSEKPNEARTVDSWLVGEIGNPLHSLEIVTGMLMNALSGIADDEAVYLGGRVYAHVKEVREALDLALSSKAGAK